MVPGMTTRRLFLIRHGESESNVAATAAEAEGSEEIRVRYRDADVPLTLLGERQAAALGDRLTDDLGAHTADARLWSSPYRRAVHTGEIALGADADLMRDERLRDRELGILDALTQLGVQRRLPLEFDRRRWLGKFYYRPPGGESWADLALRIRSFVADVDWRDDRPVVIFAHDAIVSVFLYVLLGLTESALADLLAERAMTNASITTLAHEPGGEWTLESLADDAHLTEAGLPVTHHHGVNDVEPM